MPIVEVVCAGCGTPFDEKEGPVGTPNRISGCCPDCNSTLFRASVNDDETDEIPVVQPEPAPEAEPAAEPEEDDEPPADLEPQEEPAQPEE
jgi:predicted  nucleic acid-binding Zn-ribbon protein